MHGIDGLGKIDLGDVTIPVEIVALDTVPPTVTIASAGGLTNQAAQTLSGTVSATEAAAGGTVTILDNGKQIGTAQVTNGSWSTSVTLSEGANSLTVTDTDAASNPGTSAAVSYTLDTVPPTVTIASAGGLPTRPRRRSRARSPPPGGGLRHGHDPRQRQADRHGPGHQRQLVHKRHASERFKQHRCRGYRCG